MSADMAELGEKYGYRPPVDQLLTLGDIRGGPRFDYLSLGLGPDDLPELIRMAFDDALWWSGEDNVEVWAPVHSWRALGDLRVEAAIGPLVALLAKPDPDEFDDWIGEELPDIFAQFGPVAIPALAVYLRAPGHGMWSRVAASTSLEKIAVAHPEARDEVVRIISGVLEDTVSRTRPPSDDDLVLNGSLISDLLTLKAVEALPVIKRAYTAARVDLSICGDLEDVEIDLGLRTERETPARNYLAESFRAQGLDPSPLFGYDPDPRPADDDDFGDEDEGFDDLPLAPVPPPGSAARRVANERKAKSKRKIAKQSRKQNRKKK